MFHYFLEYILKPAPPAELQQFFDLLPAAVHCRFVEGISEVRRTEGPAVKKGPGGSGKNMGDTTVWVNYHMSHTLAAIKGDEFPYSP